MTKNQNPWTLVFRFSTMARMQNIVLIDDSGPRLLCNGRLEAQPWEPQMRKAVNFIESPHKSHCREGNELSGFPAVPLLPQIRRIHSECGPATCLLGLALLATGLSDYPF